MNWAAEEFKDIDLVDQRLNRCVILLTERLAEKPTASIPGACGGWAEAQRAGWTAVRLSAAGRRQAV